MNQLRMLGPEIWETSAPLRAAGMQIGHRMTVVRLGVDGLWVHSPVEWSAELGRELAQHGEVRHVIAPSLMHDMYLDGWRAGCRTALFWAAPGLRQRMSRFPFTGDLDEAGHAEWREHITTRLIAGMPKINEMVFLHHASKTLIVADLVFNLPSDTDGMTAMLARLNGIHGKLAVSRLFRSMIRDKSAVAASVREVLKWDFDRLVMGHGDVIATAAARQLFAAAWAWLPGAFPEACAE
jgi:hypothetical protein